MGLVLHPASIRQTITFLREGRFERGRPLRHDEVDRERTAAT
jgi:hypothetical protein